MIDFKWVKKNSKEPLNRLGLSFARGSKVTVFMPVYNGEKFLREAIESVLNQTYDFFEFLIINDGSTDRSKEIIRSYSDARIHLIENGAPSGLKAVRNQGLKFAKGQYVAPIDCDDVWLPRKLEKQVNKMDENPELVLVGSRASFIDENGKTKGFAWRFRFPPKKIAPFLLFGNYFIHSSVLMRRSMIPQAGYETTTAEDYDLWMRMSRTRSVWSLPDHLVKYRVHSGGDTYRQAVLTNRTQQQVRNIYHQQLKHLGIELTEKELRVHCAIGNRTSCSLTDAGEWLVKIFKQNERSLAYDPKALLQIIVERWLITCFSSLRKGFLFTFFEYFKLKIPKSSLFLYTLGNFIPFCRYLKNRDLGKFR